MILIVILILLFIIYYVTYIGSRDDNLSPREAASMDKYIEYLRGISGVINQKPVIKLSDVPGSIPYVGKIFSRRRMGVHIGQRKLLLTEIQFLTDICIKIPIGDIHVVYAGAAPGHHDHLLSTMFPRVRFILVDPRMFDIRVYGEPHVIKPGIKIKYWYHNHTLEQEEELLKSLSHLKFDPGKLKTTKNIILFNKSENPEITNEMLDKMLEDMNNFIAPKLYLIEDYFTDMMAEKFSKIPNVFFISDIRTNSGDNDESAPSDMDVLWNLAQQAIWVKLMRPRGFMLKFRNMFENTTPGAKLIPGNAFTARTFEKISDLGIDMLNTYNSRGVLNYLRGDIYVQPWPGPISTESRLVAFNDSGEYGNMFYDGEDYEDRFMYFNLITRGLTYCYNPYANRELGFDHCQDCALESHIWSEYAKYAEMKTGFRLNILTGVESIVEMLNRDLFLKGHGYYFVPGGEYIKSRLRDTFPGVDDIKFVPVRDYESQPDYPRERDFIHKERIIDYFTGRMKDVDAKREYVKRINECLNKTRKYSEIQYLVSKNTTPGGEIISKKFVIMGAFRSIIPSYKLMYLANIMQCYILSGGCKTFVISSKYPEDDIISYVTNIIPGVILLHFNHPGGDDDSIRDANKFATPGYHKIKSTFNETFAKQIPGDYIYYNVKLKPYIESPEEYHKDVVDLCEILITCKPKYYATIYKYYSFLLPPGHELRPPNADKIISEMRSGETYSRAIKLGLQWDKSMTYVPGGCNFLIMPYGFDSATSNIVFETNTTPGDHIIEQTEITETMLFQIFYYRGITRCYLYHENPGAIPSLKFDNCGDCAMFYKLIKSCDDNDPGKLIEEILSISKTDMNYLSHGCLTEPLNEKVLKNIYLSESALKRLYTVGGDDIPGVTNFVGIPNRWGVCETYNPGVIE